MTGFQFGRKLGDWGKEEDPADREQVGLKQVLATLSTRGDLTVHPHL